MSLKSLKDWFTQSKMTKIKVNAKFFEAEFEMNEADKQASWEMYVELLTRITTQPLTQNNGDESTALDSIYSLFGTTRVVMKTHGRDCLGFTKVAVVVLNQVIRPFTAKWHKLSLSNGFSNQETCIQFREELNELQKELIKYTQMLGVMAEIDEDLTELEKVE